MKRKIRRLDSLDELDALAYSEQRGCLTKKSHTSKRRAKLGVKAMETKEGVPFKSYKCPFCEMWHLAHDKG
jgi:hypothetical protein